MQTHLTSKSLNKSKSKSKSKPAEYWWMGAIGLNLAPALQAKTKPFGAPVSPPEPQGQGCPGA